MSLPQSIRRPQRAHQWWVLAGFITVVAIAAAIGGLGVSGTATEYDGLRQPGWAPPSWLFGPVWTVLYAMIAVSGWLVWREVGADRRLWPYVAQLILNAAWTPLFFGAGEYGLAFADIAVLWLFIVATVVLFARIHRVAALLLLPYLAWVTYAAALNLSIWLLNT